MISGINDDAGKLRQFLSDAYQNGCEYVLLGGDINILPIRYAYYNYLFIIQFHVKQHLLIVMEIIQILPIWDKPLLLK